MEAEEAFKRLQLSGLQPDEETFIALINGWAGSNRSDAPVRCADNLSKMIAFGFTAPIELYEKVFLVWEKSGSARTVENLNDLRRLMESTGMPMSQTCYDAYATAITRNEDRIKAPVLLDALVREVEVASLDPTIIYVNLALAWTKQRQSGAAARAEEVLWRIESEKNGEKQGQGQGQGQGHTWKPNESASC